MKIKLKNQSHSTSTSTSTTSSQDTITIEDKYQSKNLKEQILDEPDTYIGSLEPQTEMMWVLDHGDLEQTNKNSGGADYGTESETDESDNEEDFDDNHLLSDDESSNDNSTNTKIPLKSKPNKVTDLRMIKQKITFIPGLYKLFDEILVNAIDQWVRQAELIKEGQEDLRPVKNIKISVDQEAGTISVLNDGDGIDVAMHQKEKMYVPQMIFGKLLTSGNYRNHEKGLNLTKITGGKNGYGSKLTCLFSEMFEIETVDHNRKKKYIQVFENNLSIINEPLITDSGKTLPYTKITYKPDLKKFGLDKLDQGLIRLIEKRAYDTAGYCEGVNVFYNDEKIPVKDFEKYTYLYLGNKRETKRFFSKVNDRWQVCVCASPNHELEQVSLVNGIWTLDGGKHVDHVADQIARKLAKDLTKGKTKVDMNAVKANMWVFIKCVIENPQFGSQAKEKLTTKVEKFGSKCNLSADEIVEIGKCKINTLAKNFSSFKESQQNLRNLGRKSSKIYLAKLLEGKHAGTKNSHKCTLILTEGDSAKPFAVNGLKVFSKAEREYWSIFPLKGKLLNTRTCSIKQLNNNEEIMAILQILGLRKGTDYTNDISRLRYGNIMILTDQDPDGDHIKGLIMNFLHHFWPSLLKRNDFIRTMITPLVMNWKEKKIGRKILRQPLNKFYSKKEYENWKLSHSDQKGWITRYYKGLGTSKDEDAQASFKEKKIIQYIDDNSEDTKQVIQLAFQEDKADQRKDWLYSDSLMSDDNLDYNIKTETYPDFINKRLKVFSLEDCHRSIPNLCDGLKPSQRKIIYTVLRHNISKKSFKVDQLVGKVTAETAYHHGEKSLAGAIVNLAQNYVGSNNINLLYPDGNFGTRLQNGKDSSATRYIFTKMETILPKIFRKEDFPLYRYTEDDDIIVEPTFFSTIIPMILVNGSEGIGTGFSTNIPPYNPLDLVNRIRKMINGTVNFDQDLIPWYRGFRGSIRKIAGKNSYQCKGRYSIGSNSISILELPIGLAFDQYKIYLESLEKPIEKVTKNKKDKDTKLSNNFIFLHKLVKTISVDASTCTAQVFFIPGGLNQLLAKGVPYIEKQFKLTSSISINNLTAFNEKNEIKQYNSAQSILDAFFKVRLDFYFKRQKWLIDDYTLQISKLNAKYRFVCEIMDEKIIIKRKKRHEIIDILQQNNYPTFDGDKNNYLPDDNLPFQDEQSSPSDGNYNYLLSMRIYSFSQEMLEKLKKDIVRHQDMLDLIKKQTPQDLWLADLEDFQKEYQGFMDDWYESFNIKPPTGKIKLGLSLSVNSSNASNED